MKTLLKELRENKILISLNGEDIKLKFNGQKPSATLISRIKENKAAIISYLKKEKNEEDTQTGIPKVLFSENGYPLSSAQFRLWIMSQIKESSASYNMPFHIWMAGEYDLVTFERAIHSVIDRHEILRTVFRPNDHGEVKQWVLPRKDLNFTLDYIDVSTQDKPEQLALSIIEKDYFLTFDLTDGPLLRFKMVKVSDNKWLFYYNMHHIISDGWSVGILSRDTAMIYEALIQNQSPNLPELNIQYKDYATWQLKELGGQAFQKHKTFWGDKLSGDLPILNLPGNKQRPTLKTYNGRQLSFYLDKDRTAAIRDYVAKKKGTFFMFLLASLNVLFHRYSAQEDLITGSPVAGRKHSDLENQIGLYLNTLVLRHSINGEMSFDEVFDQVKQNLFEVYAHQNYPFDSLVEDLDVKRDTSRSALFDIMIILQNFENNKDKRSIQSGEAGIVKDNGVKRSMFDVTFDFAELKDHLKLELTYNTDVYDFETMKRMIEHFQILVTCLIDKEQLPVKQHVYITQEEEKRLLREFNTTHVTYSKDRTVVDLFEQQADLKGDKIAVYDHDNTYTYKALKEKSDNIGLHLIKKLGDENEPIGVVLDRSAELVAILLGILKAGKSYIPIDPKLPKERIDYIINSSKTRVIISDSTKIESKIFNEGIELINYEKILNQNPSENLEFNKTPFPTDTAYIIYTSGSTGNPKGVEIGHQSLFNFLTSIRTNPGMSEIDTMYAVTTFSFDISILEFFTPLISGASVYIASNEILSDPNLIIEDMKTITPSIVQATPSFYQLLFNAGWKGDKSLKILCGGDALNEALAEKLIQSNGQVWNMYGPTETTIWSTIREIKQASQATNIGKPINNTQVYILDDNLNIVPKGVAGEIYIGGDGLAKGYFQNKQLTNEKFINAPVWLREKEEETFKIYNTGDVGKWKQDGTIQFLGRNDHQVKIRGHRIELGEIEKVLLQSSEKIKQAVVIARIENGENSLIAFYTLIDEVDKFAIKSYLTKKLPAYMVPSFFKELEEIPLTPNKKVDRKRLPAINDTDIIRSEYVKPRNEMEETIVEIVMNELGDNISKVGVTDNFFDLGFNSLTLMKIMNQTNTKLKLNLKPLDFFQFPNVQSLMDNVLNLKEEEDESLLNISEDMDSIVDFF